MEHHGFRIKQANAVYPHTVTTYNDPTLWDELQEEYEMRKNLKIKKKRKVKIITKKQESGIKRAKSYPQKVRKMSLPILEPQDNQFSIDANSWEKLREKHKYNIVGKTADNELIIQQIIKL